MHPNGTIIQLDSSIMVGKLDKKAYLWSNVESLGVEVSSDKIDKSFSQSAGHFPVKIFVVESIGIPLRHINVPQKLAAKEEYCVRDLVVHGHPIDGNTVTESFAVLAAAAIVRRGITYSENTDEDPVVAVVDMTGVEWTPPSLKLFLDGISTIKIEKIVADKWDLFHGYPWMRAISYVNMQE